MHLLPTQNPSPTPQNHAFPHHSMLPNPNLPPQHSPILHHTRPRNPRLCRNHNILSYQAVMPNMHQIIDLRPPPNPRLPQSPAIDRRISPNLNIVLHHQPPLLRKQHILSRLCTPRIPKPRSPQNSPSLHHNPIPNHRTRIDRHSS